MDATEKHRHNQRKRNEHRCQLLTRRGLRSSLAALDRLPPWADGVFQDILEIPQSELAELRVDLDCVLDWTNYVNATTETDKFIST